MEFYRSSTKSKMRIEVVNHWVNGKEHFEFTLFDGPDGVERAHGYSTDLIVVFTKIIEWREMISRDYRDLPSGEGSYAFNVGETPPENQPNKSETD